MSDNTRNNYPSRLNLPRHTRQSNSDFRMLLFASLLNMYNDNIRIIDSLLRSNNEIRDSIINIINLNTNESSTTNEDYTNESSTTNEDYTNENTRERMYINNVPYVIENIQFYNNSRPNNSFSNDISSNLFNTNILDTFFDPISIHPTSSQIESATRIIRYGDILNPLNNTCCFTLERFDDDDNVMMIRYCRHLFSRRSLNDWFRDNCRCPICRYDIRDYNPRTDILNSPPVSPTNDIRFRRTLNTNFLRPTQRRVRQRSRLNDTSNNSIESIDSLTNLLLTGLVNTSITDVSNNFSQFGDIV